MSRAADRESTISGRRGRPLPGLPAFLLAGLAALFLLALVSPASEPENHNLVFDHRPAAEILVLLGLLAVPPLFGRRLPAALRIGLALVLFCAALVNLGDALLPGLFGRELDLYWDSGHVPALLGLFYHSAGWRRGALVTAEIVGAGVAALVLTWVSLWLVERAAARRGTALVLLVLAIAGGGAAMLGTDEAAARISTTLSSEMRRQGFFLYRAWRVAHGHFGAYAAALATPQPATADLAKLKHQDVYLVFFESYGTVVLDNPEYRARIEPALRRFEAKVAASGFHLLSHRMLSPTFGGGSWLAHGTMSSGVKLDQFLSRLLLESDRRSLPRYMAAAGYRTVNVMPGIKKPWPEGKFWGFDDYYLAAQLAYPGIEFGWFGIPDQYTLKTLSEREPHADGRPLYAQIVLVSSHTPFFPVPPYVADWNDAGAFASVSPAQWERIFRQPDWDTLKEPYLDSVTYDLDVLGDWLATRVAGGALVVILGDHQPPAFISGDKQPWTVPIYVLSRDPELVAPFAARGYRPGAAPVQAQPWPGMESFLPDFLTDFSTDDPRFAARGAPAAPTAR